LEPAEGADRHPLAGLDPPSGDGVAQPGSGGAALGEPLTFWGGEGEAVAAGVGTATVVSGEPVGAPLECGEVFLEPADAAGEAVLGAGVVGGESGEAGDFGCYFGVFADEGIAGGDGFDLGVGQHHLGVEVFDGADTFGGVNGGGDLGDEPGFSFDGAPSPNFRQVTRTIECNARSQAASGEGIEPRLPSIISEAHAARSVASGRHSIQTEIVPRRRVGRRRGQRLDVAVCRKEPSIGRDSV
jgi:hypothetical protein